MPNDLCNNGSFHTASDGSFEVVTEQGWVHRSKFIPAYGETLSSNPSSNPSSRPGSTIPLVDDKKAANTEERKDSTETVHSALSVDLTSSLDSTILYRGLLSQKSSTDTVKSVQSVQSAQSANTTSSSSRARSGLPLAAFLKPKAAAGRSGEGQGKVTLPQVTNRRSACL